MVETIDRPLYEKFSVTVVGYFEALIQDLEVARR